MSANEVINWYLFVINSVFIDTNSTFINTKIKWRFFAKKSTKAGKKIKHVAFKTAHLAAALLPGRDKN
ncbi:hypothetical protein FSB76_28330 [Mucilaginibacter ginsenosidivorax]|uniref:Uncharacterized protein n=1 Tax=Mucilaginibacter ginsenosidivorax TaxID=862126 RepID=A0A5B8W7I0_9SPHI|nr:hypothetical protein FSB76_28330 [Mucilaginibacter ginsenosidivorax]